MNCGLYVFELQLFLPVLVINRLLVQDVSLQCEDAGLLLLRLGLRLGRGIGCCSRVPAGL